MRPPACPELLRLEYSATTGRLCCWWLGPGDKALKLANWAVWLGGGARLGSSAHVRADASNARVLATSGLLGAEADGPGAQAGHVPSRAMCKGAQTEHLDAWLGGSAQLDSGAHVCANATIGRALAAGGLLGAEADGPGAQAGQVPSRAMLVWWW